MKPHVIPGYCIVLWFLIATSLVSIGTVAKAGSLCGVRYTNSVVVDSDFVEDDNHDSDPVVLNDGKDTWVVMWKHKMMPIPSIPYQYSYLLARRSSDNGKTWTNATWPSCGDTTCFNFAGSPRLATDKQGHWVVAWTEYYSDNNKNQGRDLVVARSSDNGLTWTEPVVVNVSPVPSGNGFNIGDISFGNGVWIIAGTQYNNGRDQPFYFRSSNNGSTWSGPFYPDVIGSHDAFEVKIATNDDGVWVLAWTGHDVSSDLSDYLVYTSRSLDNAMTWSNPIAVPGFSQFSVAWLDDLAYSPASHQWMLVWSSDVDLTGSEPYIGASNIIYSVSSDNGIGWSKAAWFYGDRNDTMGDWETKLQVDNMGFLSAVWLRTDSKSGNNLVYQRCQYGDLYSWSPALDINQSMLSGQVPIETPPSISVNNTGKIISVWTAYHKPDGTDTNEATVYMTEATLSGSVPTSTCTPWLMLLLK